MEVISTEGITKRFGKKVAVDNISMQVHAGELYGFLGMNGAGKTTLIRMLLGMIKADEGEVRLFGKAVNRKFNFWNEVGYLVETPGAYPDLSVKENLEIYYKMRKSNKPSMVADIIEELKLGPYVHEKARHLSLGNRQRLGLAKALMHKPKLLILDEPINALDPGGIAEIRNLLKRLVGEGSTVFLSSHILGEVSRLANRIAIIDNGTMVKELTTDELNNDLQRRLILKTDDNAAVLQLLAQQGYNMVTVEGNEILIADNRAIALPERVTATLFEAGHAVKQAYLFTEDLEAYFLRTINESV